MTITLELETGFSPTLELEANPSSTVVEVMAGLKGDPGDAGTGAAGTVQSVNGIDPDVGGDVALATGDITGLTSALAAKAPLASPTFTGTVSGITKAMISLGNVDDTSDASKPVSTATQNALDLKSPLASPTFTGTVGGITKTMVGLGSVDNTSDAGKPVSTAQQTALNLKANIASPTFTGTVSGITAAMVGASATGHTHVSANITDLTTTVQGIVNTQLDIAGAPGTLDTLNELAAALGDDANFATTVTNSLALKAPLASPTFTGTVSGITKAMVGLGSVDNTSDVSKPISTATQTALDLKANLAGPTFTGTVTIPTAIGGDNTTKAASTAFVAAAISTLATDSAVAHLAGTETISGAKTFTGGITVTTANVTITDKDVVLGTTTGTKFGTATTQKIGFFNATPVVQQGATSDLGTVLSNLGLRASGTAYPLSTTGAVAFTGQTQLGYQIRTAQNALSANTTLGTHHKVFVDCTTGAITITLPTAAAVGGTEYVVQKVDSSGNAVVIATTSSQTINGATASNFNLTKQWQSLTFVSNGTNWTTMVSNQIHNHDAADITSGTVATARLGSGSASGTTFLRGDGTWATPTGSGDVVGPGVAVSANIATFSGTTGKLIQDSGKALPTGTVIGTTDAQALTNKDLTSGTNTFPTFNQNTTGSAAKWTTARTLAGNSVDGSANATFANKFIVQGTTDAGLTAAQFLGALATGIVKNTTTTGVLSIATAGTDYYAPGSTDVAIADGGTGVSTLPTGVLIGAGTGAITAVTAPSGTILGTTDTQTLTNKRINPRVVAMTDGATITPAGDTTDIGTVTLGGNRTMAAPSGTPVDGQLLSLRLTQDGTGSRTITWNAIYTFPAAGTPTLTTTAAATDYTHFRYNAASSKWVLQSFIPSAGLTSDFSFNTHRGINAVDPVSAQDVATKNYVDTGFIGVSGLVSTVSSAFVGITLTVKYNTGTTSWPTLDSTLAASSNVAWLFQGGDDAHVPPTVTGTATWVRLP